MLVISTFPQWGKVNGVLNNDCANVEDTSNDDQLEKHRNCHVPGKHAKYQRLVTWVCMQIYKMKKLCKAYDASRPASNLQEDENVDMCYLLVLIYHKTYHQTCSKKQQWK
eukprot:10580529-Ditylum_brightwellii.AAC.1